MINESYWATIIPEDPDPYPFEFPITMDEIEIASTFVEADDGLEYFPQPNGDFVAMTGDGAKRVIDGTEGWVEISVSGQRFLADLQMPEEGESFEIRAFRWSLSQGLALPLGGRSELVHYMNTVETLIAALDRLNIEQEPPK